MLNSIVAAGGGLIFTGCCIGIGFAMSRRALDIGGRILNWTKSVVSSIMYRAFKAVARYKYGMNEIEFKEYTVYTAAT